MAHIRLQTNINASAELCFTLSLSAELHQASMAHTGERVIAGRRNGQFDLGDTVTWEARHFGIKQRLQVRITALDYFTHFRDEMIRGIFKSMRHDHYFNEVSGVTSMTDDFTFEAPLGILGKVAEALFLRRYMRRLLETRNAYLKQEAERMALVH